MLLLADKACSLLKPVAVPQIPKVTCMRYAGRSGLASDDTPTAMSENPGSNFTEGSHVYHISHCDIQSWAHPYCSA